MEKKRKINYSTFVVFGAAIALLAAVLTVCFVMLGTINQRMKESATSNLLNTTRVIRETMEGFLESDIDSLNVVSSFCENGEIMSMDKIDILCDTMGFDWIGIVDSRGNGMDAFENNFNAADLPVYDEWTPGSTGYSDAFVGESGRSEIVLWTPIYRGEEYIGSVFGGVILTKYYSANVFTFYDGDGRTYLFNGTDGAWILKSLGTDGTSYRQTDIYSLLSASGNAEGDVNEFKRAVNDRRAGTAEFDFNGEQSYLCFLPIQSSGDWYVATVIARASLLKESVEVQNIISIAVVILCVVLAVVVVGISVWWFRKTKIEEAKYRDALFSNISANLDSVFIIYEKGGKTAFVSDNIKRLLRLDRENIGEDVGRLFDWCKIEEDDPQRTAFLDGSLQEAIVREVVVSDELGKNSRTVKLELIPANNGQKIAVLTDITKDKEIQSSLIEAMQRAEAASNAKNEFLTSMSHDLRTPINGVVGMTVIAAANLDDKNRVRDCLSKISESTTNLLNLINEVLDMSQIESGKIELASQPFNIAELLQDVLGINYPGIQEKNHTVHVRISMMEHENVIGDPARLTRIAANLISNAIKYTQSGGTIELGLRELPSVIQGYGCYELMVQDNGIGMSEEFQQKLFEPFEREDDVKLSRIQGTGLGMSIVKSIVEMMMGNIRVESEKGKGSTFYVTVNMRLNENESERDDRLKGLPVLVVDDDLVTCETVAAMLCDIGMAGEWASSGEKAIELTAERHLKGEDFLAVILDWKMPGMDGLETARRIREEVDAKVPIIILTAYNISQIEEKAREVGVDSFMTKPVYRSKLLRKMTEVTSGLSELTDSLDLPDCNIPEGRRVLLAEDNELNREIAVELLSMLGVETDCAEDGVEASELFANSEPGTYDLILMDIQMPRMNGYDATRAIREMARPDAATIPIVAMTADAFKKDEQSAREAGMNEHLTKPVSVARLTRILAHYLNHK